MALTQEEENIFNKYDNQLYQYIKIAYPGFTRLLSEERGPYLEKIDALSDLYWFYNYLLDYNPNLFENVNYKPLALFYTKAASDILSIRQCLFLGQQLSASAIERNIFETFVDLRLILKENTDERLKLYEDYQKVLIWLRLKEYEEYITELEGNKQIKRDIVEKEKARFAEYYDTGVTQDIIDNYNSVKVNYHPQYPYHWAWKIFKDQRKDRNPSIAFICKAIDIYDDYLHLYSINSIAIHNQPLMINLLRRGEGITSIPSFNKNTNSIAGLTMSFGIEIITRILEYIRYNKFDEVTTYLNACYKKCFFNS
jgi:hypothetical protein